MNPYWRGMIVDRDVAACLSSRIGATQAGRLLAWAAIGSAAAESAIERHLMGPAIRNGARVRACIALARNVTWTGDRVELHGTRLPETALAAMRGLPIGELIRHPALPADRIIENVHTTDDGVVIDIERHDVEIGSLAGTEAMPIVHRIRMTLNHGRETRRMGLKPVIGAHEVVMGGFEAMPITAGAIVCASSVDAGGWGIGAFALCAWIYRTACGKEGRMRAAKAMTSMRIAELTRARAALPTVGIRM